MDPNRDETECCGYSANNESLIAHSEYHQVIKQDLLTDFIKNGSKKYKQSILFDIHGQAPDERWIELGYITSKIIKIFLYFKMNLKNSFSTLARINRISLEELIRGKNSLGALLEKEFTVVPSPYISRPMGGSYYNGGYIVNTHAIFEDENLNGVQVELPSRYRGPEAAVSTGLGLAKAVFEFYYLNNLDATYYLIFPNFFKKYFVSLPKII